MSPPEDLHQPGYDDERRENLVLLALGEPVDERFDRHRRTCVECAGELDSYRHSVELARAGADDRSSLDEEPPASVWAGISHHLGFDHAVDEGRRSAPPVFAPTPGASAAPEEPAKARHRRGHRLADRRWRVALAAIAAAVLISASVGVGVVVGRGDDRSPTAPQVLYQSELAPRTGGPAHVTGHAIVHTLGPGLAVSVNSTGLPLRPGYYQVWLYDPIHKHMLPIGVLGKDGKGTFPLAADVDLRVYDIIDISAQDYDGVYTHKTTVLQGPLTQ